VPIEIKGLCGKGIGKVHFQDEEKRPVVAEGEIFVDWESIFHPPYVQVKLKDGKQIWMPFEKVIYIEWEKVEKLF